MFTPEAAGPGHVVRSNPLPYTTIGENRYWSQVEIFSVLKTHDVVWANSAEGASRILMNSLTQGTRGTIPDTVIVHYDDVVPRFFPHGTIGSVAY